MSVHLLLVTGTDAALTAWHREVCMTLLEQSRRRQTISYTCMAEDLDFATQTAQRIGVTLQEVTHAGGREEYPVLVRGSELAWPFPNVEVTREST